MSRSPSTPRRNRRIRLGALVVAAVVAVVATVLGATRIAWAHNSLIDTSPSDGKTVARPPEKVVLTFNEPAIRTGTKVLVTGPDGSAIQGDPRLVDTTVQQDLQPSLSAGRYTVEWRVTSADGHAITGAFTFRVRTGTAEETPTPTASPTPTAASTPSQSSVTPLAPATPTSAPATPRPDTDTGGGMGWLWLLAIIPVGLAALLGWRFSHRA